MHRRFRVLSMLVVAAVAAVIAVVSASASAPAGTGISGTATVEPQLIDDASLKASTTTDGGASVLPTTRTVAHWFGQTTDPNNGVTYDAASGSIIFHGAACDAVKAGGATAVDVIYGCPSPAIG